MSSIWLSDSVCFFKAGVRWAIWAFVLQATQLPQLLRLSSLLIFHPYPSASSLLQNICPVQPWMTLVTTCTFWNLLCSKHSLESVNFRSCFNLDSVGSIKTTQHSKLVRRQRIFSISESLQPSMPVLILAWAVDSEGLTRLFDGPWALSIRGFVGRWVVSAVCVPQWIPEQLVMS